MSDFSAPFSRTMKFEGMTLEDVEGDSGGLTYCGISRNNFPNWPGWAVIDEYIKEGGTLRAAKALALADQGLWGWVKDFYKTEIWDKNLLGQLTGQELATQVYDAVVNLGQTAIKGLQTVLAITDDGIMGPMTIQAANSRDVVDQFINWRKNRYQSIVERNPGDAKFLTGWLSRCVRSDA